MLLDKDYRFEAGCTQRAVSMEELGASQPTTHQVRDKHRASVEVDKGETPCHSVNT